MERTGTCRGLLTIGLSALLTVPAALLLRALFDLGWKRRTGEDTARPLHVRTVFICLTACYIPMYLILFPGSFAYDVPFQLKQVFTGVYSSHHPLLHTLFMGKLVQMGAFFGQVNIGAAIYTLLQILLLSKCFSRCIESIEKQSGTRAGIAAFFFYALYPLHMLMASNATKDTLFGASFALALCLIMQKMRMGVNNRENGRMILAILCSILLRNNAVYAFLAWAVLGMFCLKEEPRRIPLAVLMSTLLAMFTGACISQVMNAADGDIVEMLAVPIQQVARVRLNRPEVLSESELEAIDAAMPNRAWEKYDPTISDPVKFEMNSDAIRSDPKRYIRLYLSVLTKAPDECVNAFLMLTHGFLYPYQRYSVSGYYLQTEISDKYYDGWWKGERIRDMSRFPKLRQAIAWRFGAQGAMQWPIGYLFNMGVIIWLVLYLVLRQMYQGSRGMAFTALLPVLLLCTFLLGPCMAGRYVYPFVCILPVMAQRSRRELSMNSQQPDGGNEL
ncbi:MAG: hypothetical protein IJT77_14280 [Clostridia bacterium]|nr:hypothetical protein [Clostridia bacterium]